MKYVPDAGRWSMWMIFMSVVGFRQVKHFRKKNVI